MVGRSVQPVSRSGNACGTLRLVVRPRGGVSGRPVTGRSLPTTAYRRLDPSTWRAGSHRDPRVAVGAPAALAPVPLAGRISGRQSVSARVSDQPGSRVFVLQSFLTDPAVTGNEGNGIEISFWCAVGSDVPGGWCCSQSCARHFGGASPQHRDRRHGLCRHRPLRRPRLPDSQSGPPAEGMRFTDFQVSSAVCTASGRLDDRLLSRRIGLSGALGPSSAIGIHQQEVTPVNGRSQGRNGLREMASQGPSGPNITVCPDMWPYQTAGDRFPDLPLIEGNQVQSGHRGGWSAHDRIHGARRRIPRAEPGSPFWPPQHHVPLYVSDKFKGRSERGLFGDVVMEIDWSVGQILDALKRTGLDRHTLMNSTPGPASELFTINELRIYERSSPHSFHRNETDAIGLSWP